ncbi:FmdB family zinc ribbon protein [Luteimonas vadosa]|uniref:Putative regulatory protein FmdB zinc ribbon domain-containing protein n=1 Tax=Luteimonas vadosa TaxID=1165507 RepID=A0ABP9DTA3_9GAMM
MPIYAYRCTACDHAFDRLQKLSDPDPETCPVCDAAAVKRQLTAPAFRLSGSGWYETDFKKDGDKKRNLAEGGEGAKSDAASTSGKDASTAASDAKPADKPPAGKPEAGKGKPQAAPEASAKPSGGAQAGK